MQQSAISVPGLNRFDRVGRTRTVLLSLLLIASAGYLAAGLADSWAMRGPAFVNAGGMAVGRDFVTYWSAGNLALAGEPAAVFDVERLRATEAATVGARIGATPWFYPPTFLLIAAALASLPYLAALAAWLILPTIGLSLLLRRIAPHPWTPWLTPLFTGVSQCLIIGQNGIVTALLLGGALLSIESCPLLAGLCFGLLSYKPQLAILIGPVLLAGGHWRALVAAGATAVLLAGASWLAFGPAPWFAFFDAASFATRALETGQLPWSQMVTVFAAARMCGLTVADAYALQLAVAGASLLAACWLWWRGAPLPLRGSALAVAIPLATPFSYSYDLAVLSLPLAWLGWAALNSRRNSSTWWLLAVVWVTPVGGALLAAFAGIPVTPIVLILLLGAIVWQATPRLRPSGAAA